MIAEIWNSFRRMPLWVQVWVAAILVPVNIAPLFFVGEPYAIWVAALSVGGMLPNLPIMVVERGLSKRMALPHVLIWSPLVILLVWLLTGAREMSESYATLLAVVLVVDLISLGFDFPDSLKWLRGDRNIA